MTVPPPLDAAARAELARFQKLLDRYADAFRGAVEVEADAGIDAPTDPEVDRAYERTAHRRTEVESFVSALLAAAQRGEEDTRDAERYRYLLIDAVIAVNEDGETVFVSGLRPMMDADAIEDPEMITRYIDAARAARSATPTEGDDR